MQKTSRRPTTVLSFGNGPFPFNNPLLFVIPSVPGFPAARLSPATPDVVLFKENHTQPTEAENLDRKSGEAEGSAVRHSGAPNLSFKPGATMSPGCSGRKAVAIPVGEQLNLLQ
jgi:hypothetical protein